MKHILATMKLDPITLVDCIVASIGRVANVKLKQEVAVQRTRWVHRDRIMEGNSSKTPFYCIVATNTVGDKKQAIHTPDNGGCEQMNCGNGMG
jgi:hypothetical protein